MEASAPQALGYVGVRAKDLADWSSYGSGLLGLQRIDKSRSTLAFRMDDRKQRIIVSADGARVSAFSAGRSPMPRRSTPLRRIWRGTRSRWRAAPARLPTSAMSKI